MSYQSVDVYVMNANATKAPVEGVLVRVFDSFNKNFLTQDTTDSLGRVGFTLYVGSYNLRFYKFGTQVRQPQIIDVVEPTGVLVNAFDVQATVFEHPISNDPRLCRASGYFRDVTGAPEPNVDLQFIGEFSPILLESSAVLNERRSLRTDRNGFACVDLIRCAKYTVLVQGLEDLNRSISVPDAPSVNLPNLLFPVVESVSFDQTGPYSMKVGEVLELTPTVVASNKVPLEGTAGADVAWSSSDEAILSVNTTSTLVQLTARAKGTVELRATRRDKSIITIPDLPIQGVPQIITIT